MNRGEGAGSWSKVCINIGQEFVIGGFTPGSNGIDALVVGYYDGRTLIYAARVDAIYDMGCADFRRAGTKAVHPLRKSAANRGTPFG